MKNINKLIEQATTTEEYGWGASYEQFDKEKFAKLVAVEVREECAGLCDRLANRMMTAEECADEIRERNKGMNNYDDTDAGGDMFFDFLKVVLAIFCFVLLATALGGIVWWIMI